MGVRLAAHLVGKLDTLEAQTLGVDQPGRLESSPAYSVGAQNGTQTSWAGSGANVGQGPASPAGFPF
jgi:hypothetical protein